MKARYFKVMGAVVLARLLLVAVIGCSAGGCLTALSERSADEVLRYYSRDYRISVNFPVSWEMAQEQDDASLGAVSPIEKTGDLFRENANVTSFPIDEHDQVGTYVEAYLSLLNSQLSNFELVEVVDVQLDGESAVKLVYRADFDGENYQTFQVFAIKGRRAYLVTGMAEPEMYPHYSAVFEQIVTSFRFE